MLTHLYLIRAVRPRSNMRLDCIIEARDEDDAMELFRYERGAYDSIPDFPDRLDIEIDEIPMLTGEITLHHIS